MIGTVVSLPIVLTGNSHTALAVLVGVDFDLWIDVRLLGHPGLVLAACCSNTATVWAWRKMNPPADILTVVCVRVFLVWACLIVSLGGAEASDAAAQRPNPRHLGRFSGGCDSRGSHHMRVLSGKNLMKAIRVELPTTSRDRGLRL